MVPGCRPDAILERVRHHITALLLGVTLLAAGTIAAGCVDRPLITFENHRDTRVAVHIDGDRVLILRPHTAEGLPYSVAAWTWPRHIEVRDDVNRPILSFDADAGDLLNLNWRLDIR